MEDTQSGTPHQPAVRKERVVSLVNDDGTLVELVYDPAAKRTGFVVWNGTAWRKVDSFQSRGSGTLYPYRPTNNLIQNDVVLLPTAPEEYGSEQELIADIRAFIHRYVDLSKRFEHIAAYYVLLTWLYDSFNELPYLRLRGDYGSGKTRFLLTVGSLCYKPIFASGASTTSPIFHILNAFAGTLIIDEGDFRMSDEKADMVKILNNGNVRGMPVLRTEVTRDGEFNPRAFRVFGPKIVATRGYYQDRALESRFITEEMGGRHLRDDIPINLDASYRDEARSIRNKLLLYRFRSFGTTRTNPNPVDPTIEPRLNQIFNPLLSTISDEALREELRQMARQMNQEMIVERGMDVEAQVLDALHALWSSDEPRITVKDVAESFTERHGSEFDRPISAKWIGGIMRRNLQITTYKSNGTYIVPRSEDGKLKRLFEKYGIVEPVSPDHR